VVVKDRYPAYISWETFEQIQSMLADNYAEYDRNKTRALGSRHQAGDLGANAKTDGRQHAGQLWLTSVSRSSLAHSEKFNDHGAEETSSQHRVLVSRCS
jgi:hypothetical protein